MDQMLLISDISNGFIYFFDCNRRNNDNVEASSCINKMKQGQIYPTQKDSYNCGIFGPYSKTISSLILGFIGTT